MEDEGLQNRYSPVRIRMPPPFDALKPATRTGCGLFLFLPDFQNAITNIFFTCRMKLV
jgi:hypothetical protein